ncbi:MAG TPA: hypothetical protein VE776_04525, partial [Actinomycetota bacterium]|nr:hypothetical protein [Actinomycetota bacterium]
MARPLLPRARIRFRRFRTGSLRPAGLIRRYRTRGPWLLLVVATAVTLPSPVLGAGAPYAGAAGLMRLPTASNADIPAMALRAYRYAESWAQSFDPTCKLSWSVLAGIGRIESNHGRYYGAAARFSSTGDVTPTILGPV